MIAYFHLIAFSTCPLPYRIGYRPSGYLIVFHTKLVNFYLIFISTQPIFKKNFLTILKDTYIFDTHKQIVIFIIYYLFCNNK